MRKPLPLSLTSLVLANGRDNEALLKSLGLDVPVIPKAKVKPKPKAKPKPRAVEAAAYEDNRSEDDDEDDEEALAPRRSGRARVTRTTRSSGEAGYLPKRSAGGRRRAASPESNDDRQPQRKAQRLGIRTQDPYVSRSGWGLRKEAVWAHSRRGGRHVVGLADGLQYGRDPRADGRRHLGQCGAGRVERGPQWGIS